jgi:5-methyltetrahydropteroyltriglutamate--homocysteine methyltransferase
MRRSTERILTTNVGSLARRPDVLDLMRAKEHGEPYDEGAFRQKVREAVFDVVGRQAAVGVDVVSDGEQGKVSFFRYATARLDGFSPTEGKSAVPLGWRQEMEAFPEYYERYLEQRRMDGGISGATHLLHCVGPVRYTGHDELQADIRNLQDALAGVDVEEAFLPSTSPKGFGENRYYASDEDYLEALGEAMREEYRAIVDAGLLLQIDDPWLTQILQADGGPTEQDRRRAADRHIEYMNHVLRDIPADRVRFHACYGVNHGPRVLEVPMRLVAEYLVKLDVGAYSFEAANPRHQHEWRVWEEVDLPEDKVLLPGLLNHATNYVEHPELIAEYLVRYAGLVGRERVIASADCGFSSQAYVHTEVHPTVVWAKLEALAQGAELATKRLWP